MEGWLKRRSEDLTLLEAYSQFLQENGYLDTDWIAETPTALDQFMKEYDKRNRTPKPDQEVRPKP